MAPAIAPSLSCQLLPVGTSDRHNLPGKSQHKGRALHFIEVAVVTVLCVGAVYATLRVTTAGTDSLAPTFQ
jgi:hypothetical protein